MARRRKRIPVYHAGAHGAAPGTLIAPADAAASRLEVLAYSHASFCEEPDVDLARIAALRDQYSVVWVNLVGLADVDLLERLGEQMSLHHLALEDTLNIPQRPKYDDYGDHQYLVARIPVSGEYLASEQISVFFGEGFLLTVQERPGDCFEGVRTRIRDGRPRIRESGSDYLAYAVIDAIVDSYFPLIEASAVRLDELELKILEQTDKHQLAELYDLKRSLIILRRYLGPLRELVAGLMREENPVLTDKTRVFMRDCLDHANKAHDLVESYRDIATGLMDLFLSLMSQRMNEVMKVLTIIATVFIPLSFVAGLYGMNFDPGASPWNMPELGWRFGYPAALGVMIAVAGVMLAYFWRKGWFR